MSPKEVIEACRTEEVEEEDCSGDGSHPGALASVGLGDTVPTDTPISGVVAGIGLHSVGTSRGFRAGGGRHLPIILRGGEDSQQRKARGSSRTGHGCLRTSWSKLGSGLLNSKGLNNKKYKEVERYARSVSLDVLRNRSSGMDEVQVQSRVGREKPTGLGPCATYFMRGQWPTPQTQAFWSAMPGGQVPYAGYGPFWPGVPGQMIPEQEVNMLKSRAEVLSSQLEQIRNRISELEKASE